MRALIDLDVLCYEIGNLKDDEGHPFPWPVVRKILDDRIELILEVTEAESWQGYLTGSGNFREEIATIIPYKGNRDRGARPFWFAAIYNYLRDVRGAHVVFGMEADDQLAIDHSNSGGNTIVCSRDKDLKQVPGWHYTWPSWKQEERFPFYVNEVDGLRSYYTQLIVGDTADNILGLYNVGPKSAVVKRIQEHSDELSMFREVKREYELRFGSYWDMFMCENGRLLWLKRHSNDDWYQRQKELLNDCRS